MDGWALWLLLVGSVLGAVITWLLLVRLPRGDDDVSTDERRGEAAWIAATIERRGGVAPVSFVEEVLDLHAVYLRTPRASAEATPSEAPPPPAPRGPAAPATRPPAPPAARPPASPAMRQPGPPPGAPPAPPGR